MNTIKQNTVYNLFKKNDPTITDDITLDNFNKIKKIYRKLSFIYHPDKIDKNASPLEIERKMEIFKSMNNLVSDYGKLVT